MKKYLERIYGKSNEEFKEELKKDLKNNQKRFIVTVNPECLMMALNDKDLNDLLLDKEVLLVPDGIAVVKACQKLKIPITERITGIDISSNLLEEANRQGKSIYLLGAKEDVVSTLVEKIKKQYPNIKVLGYSNGYVQDKDDVMKRVVKLKPDICLVALGMGVQEKLIYKYIDEFKKGIFVGVGGSFDVLSGMKKRAPKIFIKLNLEWLYRIIKEPKRLKRFWNNNVKFLFKIKR